MRVPDVDLVVEVVDLVVDAPVDVHRHVHHHVPDAKLEVQQMDLELV